MGALSLALAIFSLLISILTRFFFNLGVILAAIGIILGAIGRRKTGKHRLATAGMICSIISFVLGIGIVYIAWYT